MNDDLNQLKVSFVRLKHYLDKQAVALFQNYDIFVVLKIFFFDAAFPNIMLAIIIRQKNHEIYL